MSKHTAGEWSFDPLAEEVQSGLENVCDVFGDSPEQSRANGRLIAAAPELLCACKALIAARDLNPVTADESDEQLYALSVASQMIRNAVAKAEGTDGGGK